MHWNTVKRIMRYLKGTLSYGLLYSAGSNKICYQVIPIVILLEKLMTVKVQDGWCFI